MRSDLVQIHGTKKSSGYDEQAWREASNNGELSGYTYSKVRYQVHGQHDDEDLCRHVDNAVYDPVYSLRRSAISVAVLDGLGTLLY